jgi:hypothetical protein
MASFGLAIAGCEMTNPAFDDGNELVGDDSGSDEVGTTGESESESGTATTDDSTSSTDATTDDATSSTDATTDDATTDDATSDDATSDTGPDCMDGQALCDGVCIDVTDDSLNCGECGMACADNQTCVSSACVSIKRVFVTSVPFAATLSGIAAADDFCNLVAGSARLDGTFKAWLSTPNSIPAQGFSKLGAYVRTDGVTVADSWADLIDGQLDAPINVDQNGVPLSSLEACGATTAVWSATTADGLFAGSPNCSNWTTSMIGTSGRVGDAYATDAKWTNIGDCFVNCAEPLAIYCIQQ